MKLTMHLGSRSYDIILKRGCLANLHQFTDLAHRKVFVLTDSGVPADYARTVLDQCADGTLYTVPQGETSKSLKVYGEVLGAMLAFGMGRRDLLVAVGGGVVGDLGGFCAATYMRGIDFVNCPTTTLSQIDSSIGGKTGLDLGATKNIVGAFWQPRAVLIDPDTLATLPRRQYVNGLAEAVKAGLIADPELFELFETGARRALNFGHTIGHGIEAVKGVRGRRTNGLYHGECVALGMLPMIEDRKLQKRTRAVLRKLGLPVRTGVDKRKVLGYMQHDKKGAGSTITVIRVPGLGCWRADAIPMSGLPALLGLDEE
mgnify:CR=1 FL=1